MKEYKFVPKVGEAKVISNILHVRLGKPFYTDVGKARTVRKGEILNFLGYVLDGEDFEGNTKWYLDPQGNFFWAGGVREVINKSTQSNALPVFIWPIKKSFQRVSQSFSELWSANNEKQHTGTDIAVPAGEKVFASADGKVVAVGDLDVQGKWARYIVLEHTSPNYCTAYLHVEPDKKIRKGKIVKRKEKIALVAQTSGPHLHFNIWRGVYGRGAVRGALPLPENQGKIHPISDPAFPNKFVDPMIFNYEYIA